VTVQHAAAAWRATRVCGTTGLASPRDQPRHGACGPEPPIEAYLFAAAIYLCCTFCLIGIFKLLERHFLGYLAPRTVQRPALG